MKIEFFSFRDVKIIVYTGLMINKSPGNIFLSKDSSSNIYLLKCQSFNTLETRKGRRVGVHHRNYSGFPQIVAKALFWKT